MYFSQNTAWPRHRDTGNSSYCDISHLCKSFIDKHTNEIYELSMPFFQAVQASSIGDLELSRPAQLAELSCSEFDPELFSHSAYDKFFVTFATKVPYLIF